jgi:hypothetical protein
MTIEICHRHPGRLAVEHCELCGRPVCGSCLWYAEAGQRLCPDHAADALRDGQPVIPPERYAQGIAASEVSAARPRLPDAPYRGNSTDMAGLVAAGAGLSGLLYCAGFAWAIPFVAFILGLVAWLQARDSINPQRTRWLAALGMAGGGVYLLVVLGFMLMIGMCMLSALAASWVPATRP